MYIVNENAVIKSRGISLKKDQEITDDQADRYLSFYKSLNITKKEDGKKKEHSPKKEQSNK